MRRIAVVGAGGVGCYLAARLASAGRDVTLVCRPHALESLRSGGVRLVSGPASLVTWPAVAASPEAVPPCDLVILAVKAQDVAGALPTVAALLANNPNAHVLTLQNGVDAAEELAAAVGPGRVLAGAAYLSATLTAPGVVQQAGLRDRVVFGPLGPEETPLLREHVAAALRVEGITPEAAADGRAVLWNKLMFLAAFSGFTAASRVPLGRVWHESPWKEPMREAVREVARVARAEGVPVEVPDDAAIDGHLSSLVPSVRSSLLVDLERGRPLELPALHGAIVRRAQARGVPIPVISTLHALLWPHLNGTPAHP